MTADEWRQAQLVIAQALGLDADGQERLIDETYPGDTEQGLRRELLDLLGNVGHAAARLATRTTPATAGAAGARAGDDMSLALETPTLPPFALEPGDMCGRYRIVRHIGSGGMGRVFLAEDTELGTTVALKVLPAHAAESDRARTRLRREARHAAALRGHPHIATLFDVIDADVQGRRYPVLVMEYVEGRSAKAIAADGPVTLPRVLRWAAQIAEAVEFAHDRGLLHCDLKPANVQITPDDKVKVLDFGVARAIHGAGDAAEGIAGTPAYMAPEQIVDGQFVEAGDVYSLGVLLFELVTGRRPFEAPDVTQLVVEIVGAPPPKASDVVPSVPAALDALLQRALAKTPRQRYQSATEFRRDLAAVIESLAPPQLSSQVRVRSFAAAAAVVFLYVTLLGFVSSWTLDLTVGRTGNGAEFRSESALTWPVWGARSVLYELLFALVGFMALLVTREACRLAYSMRLIRQSCGRSVDALRAGVARVDAVTIARALLVVQVAAFCAFIWYFWPLFHAIVEVSLQRASLRAVWRDDPVMKAVQSQHAYAVGLQLFAFGGAWWAAWPRLRARREQTWPLAAVGIALLASTLLLTPPVYRLVHHNDGELVTYRSETCYLVGQSGERALLLCPLNEKRRRQTVSLQDPELRRSGVREDVFTIFATD